MKKKRSFTPEKNEKEDRSGEQEKRARIRATYGENRPCSAVPDGAPFAVCKNGTFVGRSRDGIASFKGIPFALPPVGDLRWKPPVAPEDADGVTEAYYFGHTPIQTEWPSEEGSYYPQSEDCLTLNVWAAEGGGDGRAVMVFFHGGSYGWGATSDPIYDGHNLVDAHRDVILVTAEYRVGIMGFLDFSEVPGGEDYRESGNLGLLDHIAALRWVQANIAAFGGDPGNVTIFGESAGGGTVSLLSIMPQAKGLFRRAIAESGSVALTYSRKECLKLTRRLMTATGATTMAELTALPEAALRRANEGLNDYNNFPERDGVVLPEDLYGAWEKGASAGIDFMIGTNADETKYWIREMGYYTENWLGYTVYKLGIPVMFDSNMARVTPEDKQHVHRYMHLFSCRKLWKTVAFFNDILFRLPAIREAEFHAQNGGRAYTYYWTYPSAHKHLGACHAVELAYVFNNPDVQIYTGDNIDEHLLKEAQDMWVNFAKTGDPSTAENHWEPYDGERRMTAVLGKKITMESDPLGKRREAATPLLKYYFNGCYTNLSLRIPFPYVIAAAIMAVLGVIPAGLVLLGRRIARLFRKKKKR